MLCRDLLIFVQEVTNRYTERKPDKSLVNPACGCKHPGKELKCEDCPELEACMSRIKSLKIPISSQN